MQVQVHSITDLITNSSTVIYTYSDESVAAFEALIDEVLKVLGRTEKCADLFRVALRPDDYYSFASWLRDQDNAPDFSLGACRLNERLEALGEDPSPPPLFEIWCAKFLDSEDYKRPNTLVILPRAPEYAKLAELAVKFLYSTDHESCCNG